MNVKAFGAVAFAGLCTQCEAFVLLMHPESVRCRACEGAGCPCCANLGGFELPPVERGYCYACAGEVRRLEPAELRQRLLDGARIVELSAQEEQQGLDAFEAVGLLRPALKLVKT